MESIKHLWFDFSDTIGRIDREVYNKILYAAYGEAVGKPVTEELIAEFAEVFKREKSNSAVFSSLNKPAGYLADQIATVDPKTLYTLTDENIPAVLQELRTLLPISILSNNKMDKILPALGIDTKWFTHILGPDDVAKPKPHLDGFLKMVEVSQAKAAELLYIGDSIDKDLLPAKQVGIMTGLLWNNSEQADYCFKDFRDILKFFKHE